MSNISITQPFPDSLNHSLNHRHTDFTHFLIVIKANCPSILCFKKILPLMLQFIQPYSINEVLIYEHTD